MAAEDRCIERSSGRQGALFGTGRRSATSPARHRALLGVVVVALFAAGFAAGGLVHASARSVVGSSGYQSSAWPGPPDGQPVVPPVAPEPTTTVPAPPPAPAPAPPPQVAAPPSTLAPPPPEPSTPEARISAALARISYPWQQLGYRIVFLGPQPGISGRTSPRSMGFIDIYVRPDENVDTLAHVIAHELGHAVDLTYGNDQRRALWERLRGITAQSWFTCSMCQDFSTPAGDFAETFAFWQLHDYSRSQLAPAPTPTELSQLAPLFGP